MNEITKWITKHIGTLFSLLGVIATIYFSLFHIPEYLQEMKNEKVRNVHIDLVQSTQEVAYNDSIELDYKGIETLIKSKELKNEIQYPYSVNQLLSLVQESFMEQKFLPLEERQGLFQKLESIKEKSEPALPNDNEGVRLSKTFSWVAALIGLIGSLVSLFGLWAAIKDKSELLKKEKEEKNKQIEKTVKNYHEFEKTIFNILQDSKSEFSFIDTVRKNDLGYDFIVENSKKSLLGEIKYYTHGHRLKTAFLEHFYHLCQLNGKSGILILNKEVSEKESELLQKFNTRSDIKIHAIVFRERNQLIEEINKIMSTTHNNA